MSNTTKADLSLLKSYKSSFDNEKQRYTYNTYNTFSGGYISSCSDKYVQRMKTNLSYHYNFISDAYSKINTWWTNYNNDLECLENGLTNDRASGSGIKEASVRSSVNALPTLTKLNIGSFMTFEERRKKGEELKKHYSQSAAPVTPLKVNSTEVTKTEVKKPNKTVGKKIWDGVSDAWCMVECTGTETLGYLSDGLTMMKAGGTIALGSTVSFFRVLGGDLTWKDIGNANRQTIDEAMDEIDARREASDKKTSAYMDEAIKRKEEDSTADYWKKLPATVADVGYNFGKGTIGLGEKIRDSVVTTGDLIGGGIAYVSGRAQGIDSKYLNDMINQSHEETAANVAENTCQVYMFDDVEQSELGQYVVENSALGETERSFVQGVGEMAGVIALSAALTPGAVGGGATISPVAMGGVGFVTGQGEGLQNAYADGADFYSGYAYGTVNGVIEGASWYVGGKINAAFRAENMGSKYMIQAINDRILLDMSTAGIESAARTESAIIYKRKEDGSWYTPAEIWEMYDGSKALEQNVLLALVGSTLGEASEFRQARKVAQMENLLVSGDSNKIAKKIATMKSSDIVDFTKYGTQDDINFLLNNTSYNQIALLANTTDATALSNIFNNCDDIRKKVFLNNLSDDASKVFLNNISVDKLNKLLEMRDVYSLNKILSNGCDSKELLDNLTEKINVNELRYAYDSLDVDIQKKVCNSSKSFSDTINSWDSRYGFQLTEKDLAKSFPDSWITMWREQGKLDGILENINKKGYIDYETSITLKSLLSDNSNYDIYLKTIHSNDMNSVFDNGIYCLNNSTSGMGNIPMKIDDINLDNTVTKVTNIYDVVNILKSSEGISQGGNPINGTVIIAVPKDISVDNMYTYLLDKKCFTIDRSFVFGFAQNGGNGYINPIKLNPNSEFDLEKLYKPVNKPKIVNNESKISLNQKVTDKINNKTSSGKKAIIELSGFSEASQVIDVLDNPRLVKYKINGRIYTFNDLLITNRFDKTKLKIFPVLDLKRELLETIDDNMDPITKARQLYIELNKRVEYDLTYVIGNEATQAGIMNNVVNFDNLSSKYVVCKGWSELYRDILIDSGFDPNNIIIAGGEGHKWVEIIMPNNTIIKADATEVINGTIDLSNCKFNGKTSGFIYTSNDCQGMRINKSFDKAYLEDAGNAWKAIDANLGYLHDGGYTDEILASLKSYDIGSVDNINTFRHLINSNIFNEIDGYDAFSFLKKISKEYNLKSISFDLKVNDRGSVREGFLTIIDSNKIYTISDSTGRNVFSSKDEYNEFIEKLNLIKMR